MIKLKLIQYDPYKMLKMLEKEESKLNYRIMHLKYLSEEREDLMSKHFLAVIKDDQKIKESFKYFFQYRKKLEEGECGPLTVNHKIFMTNLQLLCKFLYDKKIKCLENDCWTLF